MSFSFFIYLFIFTGNPFINPFPRLPHGLTRSLALDVSLSSSALSSKLSNKIKSEIATTASPLRSNLISISYTSFDAIIKQDFDKEKPFQGYDTGESSLGVTKCSGGIWTGKDRYLWIDLSAGPVDYGPALSGDGVLPKGEFHPLTALHGRPKSQKALLADMASLVWSAYKVLLVPSLRILVPFENSLIVQFIHIHGPTKDPKGLDFNVIEKNFTDEVKDGRLIKGFPMKRGETGRGIHYSDKIELSNRTIWIGLNGSDFLDFLIGFSKAELLFWISD